MLSYVLVPVCSSLLSCLVTLSIGWRLKTRLVDRLTARQGTLEAIRELENRRVGYESGREHLARYKAGKQARISDGMATKPGILARHRDS